jgi:hypothetical protein
MRARVIERMEVSIRPRHIHLRSGDIEDTHLPGGDILDATNSY